MDCSSAPFTFFRALQLTVLEILCPLLIFLTLGTSNRSNGRPLHFFAQAVTYLMNVSTLHLFKLTGFPSMFCHLLSLTPDLLLCSRLQQPDKQNAHTSYIQTSTTYTSSTNTHTTYTHCKHCLCTMHCTKASPCHHFTGTGILLEVACSEDTLAHTTFKCFASYLPLSNALVLRLLFPQAPSLPFALVPVCKESGLV